MAYRKYIELSCDTCGQADYYSQVTAMNAQARANGWIIVNGKHFDSEKCYREYKDKNKKEHK